MIDSQRLRTVPEGINLISQVAAILSRQRNGTTHVLEVASYFPVDVDSVGRILESLESVDGVRRVQKDSIYLYEIDNPEIFGSANIDLDNPEFLESSPAFMRVITGLKKDDNWRKKVREQHELLHIAACAKNYTVELSYFTSRSDIPSAKIQSILNDFSAEGYISILFDENNDTINYTFPQFSYPNRRLKHNLCLMECPETKSSNRSPLWLYLLILAAIILLGIIVFSRL